MRIALAQIDTTLAECRWLDPDDREVVTYERLLGRLRPGARWEVTGGVRP